MRKTLLMGAALSALAASHAFAQTAAETQPASQVAQVEEIIVTAQKREENAQKIAVAVAVVGGQQLERANSVNVGDMASLVPSVTFAAGNELRNNSVRIRGVGTDVFSTGVEASVSTVVDGVVLQRPGSAFSDLGDIERIEVLRGPQGTLFGKNSSAGVINVVTKAPNYDRFEAAVNALVAENSEYRLNGALSGPIGQTAAIRLSAFYRTQDGLVTNLHTGDTLNDQEAKGLRLKLGWRPTEHLDLLLSGDYSELESSAGALPLRIATDNPKALSTGTRIGPDNTQVNNDVDSYVNQKNYGFSLTANYALGDFTLTSISAYRRFDNDSDVDLDNTQARLAPSNFNIESSKTVTQEVRLTSPKSDVFDYVIGAYYFDGSVYNYLNRPGLNIGAVTSINADGSLNTTNPLAVLTGQSLVETKNTSVFGQANLHVGDKLTLTGGLRYLKEKQRLDFNRPVDGFFNGPAAAATNPAFGPVTGHYEDSATIGKISAVYAVTDSVNAYVGYSTGYKSEGLAATLGLTAAQFAKLPAPAETSKLLEAGVKSRLFDNRLQVNLTAFRTRFKDYQAQTYNTVLNLVALTSAGGVAVDGVELEFTAAPVAGLVISGGVTYLDARFDDVPTGPCYTGQTVAQGCVVVSGASVQNLNGKPFINAPKWRYTLSSRYTRPIANDVEGYVQGDYRWQDDVLFDMSQNPNMIQKAYGVADFSLGATFGEGRYDASVFVKNAFDKQYVSSIAVNGGIGGGNAYAQNIPRDFNRYFGAAFRAKF